LLLTTIVGAITLTVAILFLRRPIDTSIGGGDEAYEISSHRICKPAGESEHYYSNGPNGRSGHPAVPRRLRPAAPRTSSTLRAFVDQYRRTAAELAELNALLPSVPALSRMSELAALNGGYMSPISHGDMMMVTGRTEIGTFGNTITPHQVTSLHHVRSYLKRGSTIEFR
jgi:hypothetical protein